MKTSPMSIRLEKDSNRELQMLADKMGIKKATLTMVLISAGLDALRRNNYILNLPLVFEIKPSK